MTEDGAVYTWGRGDDGRLGHGDNGWKYVPRVVEALEGQRIVQVLSPHQDSVLRLSVAGNTLLCNEVVISRHFSWLKRLIEESLGRLDSPRVEEC